jgi:hypothetical protein
MGEIAPEEVAGEIEGFARCVQQGDVGGEDVGPSGFASDLQLFDTISGERL